MTEQGDIQKQTTNYSINIWNGFWLKQWDMLVLQVLSKMYKLSP